MIDINKIYFGDCLKVMYGIDDKSIDMILCDLPYEVTNNKKDIMIPFEPLWGHYKRIIKDNGCIALFGQGIFSAKLIMSNEKWFKYDLIWKKGERTSGFLNAKKQPLRNHEQILIFYNKPPTYNPQMTIGPKSHSRGSNYKLVNNNYGKYDFLGGETPNGELKYPKSILNFEKPHPAIHRTQKPVPLCEWLIRTYTNEGELVLDNTVGYGTTCIASKNTGRNFIGIENDEYWYNKANSLIIFE
jgi:site-specific DNA-methyltransferase (adenine-specific)